MIFDLVTTAEDFLSCVERVVPLLVNIKFDVLLRYNSGGFAIRC